MVRWHLDSTPRRGSRALRRRLCWHRPVLVAEWFVGISDAPRAIDARWGLLVVEQKGEGMVRIESGGDVGSTSVEARAGSSPCLAGGTSTAR